MNNLNNYLALNRELVRNKNWFSNKLENHIRSYNKQDEITKWESKVPAHVMQGHVDAITRLHLSLEWYRNRAWYTRWWLRKTTNVGWVARYYVYNRGYHVLNQWNDMQDSYESLQKVHIESQRYLASFSYDRISLNKFLNQIRSYWQQTTFAQQLFAKNKQIPPATQNDLIQILKQTNKQLNDLASVKMGGFFSFSRTYQQLATTYGFCDGAVIRDKREKEFLAYDSCHDFSQGWLGRSDPSKKLNVKRQVLYYSLLTQAVNKLLGELKNKSLDSNFDAAWDEFETLVTEGIFLSEGYSKLPNKEASRIWEIYNQLFISLSQLAFNPRASAPTPLNNWQEKVHRSGSWFRTLLQIFSGNTSIHKTINDQRLHIEYYLTMADVYSQAIENTKRRFRDRASKNKRSLALHNQLQEIEVSMQALNIKLARLQKQSSLLTIQAMGVDCQQHLQDLHEKLNQFNTTIMAAADTTAVPIQNSTSAESLLLLPRIFSDERELVEGACKILCLVIDTDQETIPWEAIRKAYKRRVLETHPDKGGNTELFKLVNVAYEYLDALHAKQLEGRAVETHEQKEWNSTRYRRNNGRDISNNLQDKLKFNNGQPRYDWQSGCDQERTPAFEKEASWQGFFDELEKTKKAQPNAGASFKANQSNTFFQPAVILTSSSDAPLASHVQYHKLPS